MVWRQLASTALPLLCQAVRIKCFRQEPLPGEEIDGGHGGSAAKTTGQKATYQSWGAVTFRWNQVTPHAAIDCLLHLPIEMVVL